MRVLGYTFQRGDDAQRARQALSDRYHLRPDDAQVANLAGNGVVLGVRAAEESIDDMRALLRELGGKQVVDVDERWTVARRRD